MSRFPSTSGPHDRAAAVAEREQDRAVVVHRRVAHAPVVAEIRHVREERGRAAVAEARVGLAGGGQAHEERPILRLVLGLHRARQHDAAPAIDVDRDDIDAPVHLHAGPARVAERRVGFPFGSQPHRDRLRNAAAVAALAGEHQLAVGLPQDRVEFDVVVGDPRRRGHHDATVLPEAGVGIAGRSQAHQGRRLVRERLGIQIGRAGQQQATIGQWKRAEQAVVTLLDDIEPDRALSEESEAGVELSIRPELRDREIEVRVPCNVDGLGRRMEDAAIGADRNVH